MPRKARPVKSAFPLYHHCSLSFSDKGDLSSNLSKMEAISEIIFQVPLTKKPCHHLDTLPGVGNPELISTIFSSGGQLS